MKIRVTELAWGVLLFSMFGLCTEIAFTGVFSGWSGSFRGQVSLLMVPVYALAYLLLVFCYPILERRGPRRPAARIAVLVLAIYGVEWAAGAAYAAVGLSPWHYDHGWASAWSGGHVTLYYLPAWIVFALLIVPVGRVVQAISRPAKRAARQVGLSRA